MTVRPDYRVVRLNKDEQTATAMLNVLSDQGYRVVTGGTDAKGAMTVVMVAYDGRAEPVTEAHP